MSGLYSLWEKLADRIFFGVQGPRGLGLGCRSLCLAFISLWENSQIEYFSVSRAHGGLYYKFMGKLADRIFFGVQGPRGVGFGVPFFVSGLYTFMRKLADRIFFGVQGSRGLGLECRSLCLAFISFMGKLADRIFFGVQGPRGLGLGCRSLCLAFISLWEN